MKFSNDKTHTDFGKILLDELSKNILITKAWPLPC